MVREGTIRCCEWIEGGVTSVKIDEAFADEQSKARARSRCAVKRGLTVTVIASAVVDVVAVDAKVRNSSKQFLLCFVCDPLTSI